jgi:cytochrome P450
MAVAFDPLAQDEPYAAYRELRASWPVYRNEARRFWALSRFEDVQRAAREWTGFSSAEGVNLDDTLSLTGAGNFISADPPDHDRLRRVVRGRFTPPAVGAMESAVRDDVRGILADAVRDGGFDAADALAWTVPVRTVSRLLALPVQDERLLSGWLRAVIHREAASDRLPETARAAAGELRAYLSARLAERRREPGDDLLSDIVAGQARGELDEAELPGICILLYVAGTETVADFIGNALVALAEHPDQRALLVAQPDLVGAAVEELLRYESPVQYQVRTATVATELHGQRIAAGDRVALFWGAANRDERRWDRPDDLDVTRAPKRNLAFGEGIHHCLGAPLARLQGRIVLEEVLEAIPEYRLAGPVKRIATHNTRGVARLPLAAASPSSTVSASPTATSDALGAPLAQLPAPVRWPPLR